MLQDIKNLLGAIAHFIGAMNAFQFLVFLLCLGFWALFIYGWGINVDEKGIPKNLK